MARRKQPKFEIKGATPDLDDAQLKSLSPAALEKYKRLKELELELRIRECLPHRYGFPFYSWSRKFYNSTNKNLFLTGANQISKSYTQIRKGIEWATNKELWPSLWERKPTQFWYLYPSKELATIEFEQKWEPELLPRGELKESERFGWDVEKKYGEVFAIHFNSGVSIYFKSYMQNATTLQAGSSYYIMADEELPVDIYDELNARRRATNGHFSMVFTATLGQELWYRTMEEIGTEREAFPTAEKIQVSLLDCKQYEDGTPSIWTEERIQAAIASCKSENEVLRRVHGRFVVDTDRIIMTFERGKNVVRPYVIPSDWHWYAGIDYGSGGETGHPSTIVFVAVRPDFKHGAVVAGWKSPKGVVCTMQDVVHKYAELWHTTPGLEGKLVNQVSYDYAAKDMQTYATQFGMAFVNADKSRGPSERLLNVLFKYQRLDIFDSTDLEQLCKELDTVTVMQVKNNKNRAQDDMFDALRYATMGIPWVVEESEDPLSAFIKKGPSNKPEKVLSQREIDAKRMFHVEQNEVDVIELEIKEWNDFYGY